MMSNDIWQRGWYIRRVTWCNRISGPEIGLCFFFSDIVTANPAWIKGVSMKNLAAALLTCIVSLNLLGQTSGSQVSGIVHDSSGAAIQGAAVTITNTDTSASRSFTTGADGHYTLTNLGPGSYKLQASKEGFSSFNQTGIVLQVNTNPEIDVTLQVGAVSESISVEANTAMVETHTNAVGQVIDQQRVVDLPLNGRNVAQLITLSGASVSGTANGATANGLASNLNYPTAVAVAVAGSQFNATNYFLDGGTHIDPRTNAGHQVLGCSDAHHVARLGFRQQRCEPVHDREHLLL